MGGEGGRAPPEAGAAKHQLLAIKAGGGHAAYQIARVHGFFEEDVCRHEGGLSAAVLEKLRCGILRELVCTGKAVGLAAHFDALLAALRAPSCQVRELTLNGCDWPEGRTLAELVDALPARGLKVLDVAGMQVGGALPAALFEKCAEAEYVALAVSGLTGGIPASVGKCTKAKTLFLHGNQLEGSIPEELGECASIENLQLSKNMLTGSIPSSLGKCTKLNKLLLQQNKLSGCVPASLGKCTELTMLNLHENQLEGAVPASELAKLTALAQLALDENEGLTITASGTQEIERAAPNAKFFWPRVVDA